MVGCLDQKYGPDYLSQSSPAHSPVLVVGELIDWLLHLEKMSFLLSLSNLRQIFLHFYNCGYISLWVSHMWMVVIKRTESWCGLEELVYP